MAEKFPPQTESQIGTQKFLRRKLHDQTGNRTQFFQETLQVLCCLPRTGTARDVIFGLPRTGTARDVIVGLPRTVMARDVIVGLPLTGTARDVIVVRPVKIYLTKEYLHCSHIICI